MAAQSASTVRAAVLRKSAVTLVGAPCAMCRQPLLQLWQCNVGFLGECYGDQARMGVRAARTPIPPCALGRPSPPAWRCACQRIALDALTLNRVAAWQHDSPSAIAARTHDLRSRQRLRHAGRPPSPARTLNQTRSVSGSRPESVRAETALADADRGPIRGRSSHRCCRCGVAGRTGNPASPEPTYLPLAGCLLRDSIYARQEAEHPVWDPQTSNDRSS